MKKEKEPSRTPILSDDPNFVDFDQYSYLRDDMDESSSEEEENWHSFDGKSSTIIRKTEINSLCGRELIKAHNLKFRGRQPFGMEDA